MSTPPGPHPVRLALVGVGGHGRTMLHAVEEARHVEMAAVYDVDAGAMQQAAARCGCATAASYEALLQRDDLEAVVLVTPNALHRPQAEAAFEAGLDVLVEKPIANTVAEGLAMLEAAERSGRLLMVGHNMRRSRVSRKTRRLIDEGRLGEVVSVELHFSVPGLKHLPEDAWRLQPEQCPLLPVMQLGIHAIDLVHYFFGLIEEVFAFPRSVKAPPGVIDSVTAAFQTVGGVPGTLVSNYCTQETFAYRIAGTEATLQSNAHRLWYRRTEDTDMHGRGDAEVDDYAVHWQESYVRQMDAFGRAVREGAHSETDGRAGLQALAVVEALQQSVETHAPQSVPLLREIQTT